jgi:CRISPR-associated helicase Cas3/CRISPR-associated endonuclease Cas3-HD
MYYAHSIHQDNVKDADGIKEWQTLSDHLNGVADFAEEFARPFHMESLARIAGLLHDYGKATEDFQKRLAGSKKPVDHKSAGAEYAHEHYKNFIGKILKYCIYGHHNEMPNGTEQCILNKHSINAEVDIKDLVGDLPETSFSHIEFETSENAAVYMQTLIRMLYSALVDADYLDTERFVEPNSFARRINNFHAKKLPNLFAEKLETLLREDSLSNVNIYRRKVLNECIAAGQGERGFYTLTVPTGGGKTFSSLAFALEQIKKLDLSRVIYAVPFTTVTGQTAEIFRGIFGDKYVLEHHSNIDVRDKNNDERDVMRLHSQNWDSPLILTTTVQLLESLFSNRPSKCRKLHNISNSVIVFDEAQALPDKLLLPTLAVLRSLVQYFGCTVLFCTATQPAVDPFMGTIKPKEITSDTDKLFSVLKRVEIINLGIISDDFLCEKAVEEEQALIVVNTRRHAAALFTILENVISDGIYHLSALMCPEHRRRILGEVKERLKNSERCILVSTNLIEAGVDIDFPVVFRASAGLESIAQSAGRCNREGKLENLGHFYIFTPENDAEIPEYMKQNIEYGRETLMHFSDSPLSPPAIEMYFQLRYGNKKRLDTHDILKHITDGLKEISFDFETIAKQYKLIDNNTVSVIIPFDDDAKEMLRESLFHLRELQRYTVSVYEKDIVNIPVISIAEQVYVLDCGSNEQFREAYSEKIGLVLSQKLLYIQ